VSQNILSAGSKNWPLPTANAYRLRRFRRSFPRLLPSACAALSSAFCNFLVISGLTSALQKAVFRIVKGGLLDGKRPPFAVRFAVF